MIRIFIVCLALVLFAPAQAENLMLFAPKHPADHLSSVDYTRLVYQAHKRDSQINFDYLRNLYPKMRFYQPETDLLTRELLAHAQHALKTKDTALYDDFLMVHTAHADIMRAAYLIAQQDPIFGDAALYRWIYNGLEEALLASGDGENPETAYEVITFGEEETLFKLLELQHLNTQKGKENILAYHLHDVYDAAQDRFFVLFTDVTQPMLFRDENKRIDPIAPDLPDFDAHSLKTTRTHQAFQQP